MKKTLPILIAITSSLIIGWLSSIVQSPSLESWYPTLIKPSITPPDAAFPIAWGIIYICSGISIGLLWNNPSYIRQPLVWAWIWQLILNFSWSIIFFATQSPTLAFANIIMLDLIVIVYTTHAWRINKYSAVLFFPYLLWLTLATYLNGYIMIAN